MEAATVPESFLAPDGIVLKSGSNVEDFRRQLWAKCQELVGAQLPRMSNKPNHELQKKDAKEFAFLIRDCVLKGSFKAMQSMMKDEIFQVSMSTTPSFVDDETGHGYRRRVHEGVTPFHDLTLCDRFHDKKRFLEEGSRHRVLKITIIEELLAEDGQDVKPAKAEYYKLLLDHGRNYHELREGFTEGILLLLPKHHLGKLNDIGNLSLRILCQAINERLPEIGEVCSLINERIIKPLKIRSQTLPKLQLDNVKDFNEMHLSAKELLELARNATLLIPSNGSGVGSSTFSHSNELEALNQLLLWLSDESD